jgi:transposase
VATFDEFKQLTSIRTFEGQEFSKKKAYCSLGDISRAWALESTRNRVSRFEKQYVKNVGEVNVLKLNQ